MPVLVETRLPKELANTARKLVKEGWFPDIDSLISDALRHYLEARKPEMMARFLKDDVEWGIHGKD